MRRPQLTVSFTQRSISLMLFTFLSSILGFAQDTATWNGGVGFWSNPANWSCFIGGKSQSCVPNGGNITTTVPSGIVTLDVSTNVFSLEIDLGGTVVTNGFSIATGQIVVGRSGTGTLTVNNGGLVTASSVSLGFNPGSSGTLNVSDQGSRLTCSVLVIGSAGSGVLTISGGAKVNDQLGSITNGISGSSGAATIAGAGSRWDNAVNMSLGLGDQSTLILQDGAGGSSGSGGLIIGENPGASASMTLQGTGTTWDDTGGVIIQSNTNNVGALNVQDGAILTTTSTFSMGQAGTLTISGAGSVIDAGGLVQGHITVSGTGSQWGNSQTVTNFGSLSIQNGGIVSIQNTGTISSTSDLINNGTVAIGDGGTLSVAGTYIDQSGGLFSPSTTVLGSGILQASSVSIQAGSTLAGTGTISGSTNIGNQTLGAFLLPGLTSTTPGTLTFNGGPLTMAANANLHEVLTPAGFGVTSVRGDLFLGGSLFIEQSANYDPPAGTTLAIMSANAVHGQLILGNSVFSGGSKLWTLRIGPEGTTVSLVAVSRFPTSLSLLAPGDFQTGSTGSLLQAPLVVKTTDSNGLPSPGIPISFSVTQQPLGSLGTTLTATSVTTGVDGTASTQLILGSLPGQYEVTAACAGSQACSPNSVVFNEIGATEIIKLIVDNPLPLPSNPDPRHPTDSFVTATAEVTDFSGKAVSEFSVQFSSAASDLSVSGHAHHNLSSVPVGAFDEGVSTCKTASNGQCTLRFKTSEFSGLYNITASSSADPSISDSQKVLVQVPALLSLGQSPTYRLTGAQGPTSYLGCRGTEIQHPNNHFGSPYLNTAIADIAATYLQRTGFSLGINDMTLSIGGRFDICADWSLGINPHTGTLTGHFSHRKGTSVDIDMTVLAGTQEQAVDIIRLKFLAEKIWGLQQVNEETIHFESPF